MAYAPYHNGNRNRETQPRIMGAFNEKDHGERFEFRARTEEEKLFFAPDFPNAIYVGPWGSEQTRAARVMKTVAYVVVDEDADGQPVVEKWDIKNHILYREEV